MEDEEFKGVTPAKVVAILKRHGTAVTSEQAEGIITFMGRLARMEVSRYLADDEEPDANNEQNHFLKRA